MLGRVSEANVGENTVLEMYPFLKCSEFFQPSYYCKYHLSGIVRIILLTTLHERMVQKKKKDLFLQDNTSADKSNIGMNKFGCLWFELMKHPVC